MRESSGRFWDGAGDGIRTRDIDLGKVALYQLSYSRNVLETNHFAPSERACQCTIKNHYKLLILLELIFLIRTLRFMLDYHLLPERNGNLTKA